MAKVCGSGNDPPQTENFSHPDAPAGATRNPEPAFFSQCTGFVQRFEEESRSPDFQQGLRDAPLMPDRFQLQQLHLRLAKIPDTHIRSDSAFQQAAIPAEIAALQPLPCSRLSRDADISQRSVVNEIRPVIEDLAAFTATVAAGRARQTTVFRHQRIEAIDEPDDVFSNAVEMEGMAASDRLLHSGHAQAPFFILQGMAKLGALFGFNGYPMQGTWEALLNQG